MKSLIVIFGVLIVGIIFIVVWDFSSNSRIGHTNYNEISWRLPGDKEIEKIGETFLKSEFELCSSYFIKKFEGEKYLIACDSGNGSWTYYTAYARQDKVYLTPSELTASLQPPQIFIKEPNEEPLDKKVKGSRISRKTRSSQETILTR